MINNKTILLSTVFIVFVSISLPTEATDNPFRKASAITKKYLPQAFKAMWQSEYLVWRAQLFNSACSQKQLGVSNAISSGFPLFNQYIIDQAIMNEELSDDNDKLLLQNTNKLHYLTFSKIYAFAYKRRLEVIQHYHPDITSKLCQHAATTSKQYPADERPMLPWKTNHLTQQNVWRADLFSMRVVNKYFTSAFIERQAPFANIIDAEIYARIAQDEQAIIALTEISEGYQYGTLLMKNINKAYKKATNKPLTDKYWRPIYAQDASMLASQAYKLATISALMQIKALYPELTSRIETHMSSYIKLQLSTLDENKMRLSAAYNAP